MFSVFFKQVATRRSLPEHTLQAYKFSQTENRLTPLDNPHKLSQRQIAYDIAHFN